MDDQQRSLAPLPGGQSVIGDGDRYVLKKSQDYGGKSVVIGREAGPAAFQQALARARADAPGTWVAQELVDAPAIDRFLCAETGAPFPQAPVLESTWVIIAQPFGVAVTYCLTTAWNGAADLRS